jgi:hypothetical protein
MVTATKERVQLCSEKELEECHWVVEWLYDEEGRHIATKVREGRLWQRDGSPRPESDNSEWIFPVPSPDQP